MNKEEFVFNLCKASSKLDFNRIDNFNKASIYLLEEKDESMLNYIIPMEELAELSKEISKHARGNLNKIEILEEMADVILMICRIKIMLNIDSEMLYKAINVKLEKAEKKIITELNSQK